MENHFPPGYRFYPTEEELVQFYLKKKVEGMAPWLYQLINKVIPTLDIYEFNPWDLPQLAGEVCQRDPEQWFFFIPRKETEARGGKPKRLTTFGYWKATGIPGYVYSSSDGRIVGHKRTMVFYNGRAPDGSKTEWKMNEYKVLEGSADCELLCDNSSAILEQPSHEYRLCRVYKKSKTLRAFDRRPTTGGGNLLRLPRQGLPEDHLNYEDTRTLPSSHDQQPSRNKHHVRCDKINNPVDVDKTVSVDYSSSQPDCFSSSRDVKHNNRITSRSSDDAVMLPVDATDSLWDWINN